MRAGRLGCRGLVRTSTAPESAVRPQPTQATLVHVRSVSARSWASRSTWPDSLNSSSARPACHQRNANGQHIRAVGKHPASVLLTALQNVGVTLGKLGDIGTPIDALAL